MASGFLAFGSGFAQGLGSGAQAGWSMMQQAQAMKIRQQEATASSITALQNAVNITDPAMRKVAVQKILPGLGFDDGSSDFKKMTDAIVNGQTDYVNGLIDQLHSIGYNYDARTIGQLVARDPTFVPNLIFQAQNRANMAKIVGAIPNPDGSMPDQTSTGDMGTGAPGAGGTATAPTVDAGTSSGGTQPVVSPAPASVVPFNPPATAPLAPKAAVNPTGGTSVNTAPVTTAPTTSSAVTAPSTTQAPQVAPIQGGTAPAGADTSIVVGKDPNGNPVKWDPYSTPYVRGLNQAMDRLVSVPDSQNVISMLKDKRDQYISEQKTMYSQWLDAQHLSIENKTLGLNAYRASLEAKGLVLQQDKFAYQQKHDTALFDYSKYKDAIDQAVAERRITVEEGQAKLAQKRYELDVTKFETEPRSPAGQTWFDQQHGLLPGQTPDTTPTASGTTSVPSSSTAPAPTPLGTSLTAPGQKTIPIPAPSYVGTRDPATLGKTEADGTITIADLAVRKSVGALNEGDRLVYNPATKSYFIQVATNTTAYTKEGLTASQEGADNAQLGINAVDAVTDISNKDVSALGNLGRYKGTVQGVTSQLQDLAKTVPVLAPLIHAVGADKFGYDPNISALDGLEQAIKSKVAKALTDTGAGLGSYAIGVKSVDDLVDLTHGSRQDILGRMKIVKQILSDARDMNLAHLPTGSNVSVSTQPTTTAQPVQPSPDQQKKAQETPLQLRYDAWQQMSADQRKAKQGTVEDMTDSNFAVASDGTSHLTKIPVGQIKQLIKSLNQYKNNPNAQAQVKAYFDNLFGRPSKTSPGASALVGYP